MPIPAVALRLQHGHRPTRVAGSSMRKTVKFASTCCLVSGPAATEWRSPTLTPCRVFRGALILYDLSHDNSVWKRRPLRRPRARLGGCGMKGRVGLTTKLSWGGRIGVALMGFTPALENPVRQFNRYRYGNGNPYRFKDPDGRVAIVSRAKDGTANVQIPAKFTGLGRRRRTSLLLRTT